MAIIEEISSDDEQPVQPLKQQKLPQDRPKPAETTEAPNVQHNAIRDLVASRRHRLTEDDVQDLLDNLGPGMVWKDTLVTASNLLTGHSCDTLDMSSLERLTTLVALLKRQADLEKLAEIAESAYNELEACLTAIHDVLKIPRVFTKEAYTITSEDTQKQSFWLAGSTAVLQLLQAFIKFDFFITYITDDLDRETKMIITLSRFVTTPFTTAKNPEDSSQEDMEAWVTPLANRTASSLLQSILDTQSDSSNTSSRQHKVKLVKQILMSYIKPLFTSTPHPMLNPETGRKLDRRRGGDLFGDSYMDGEWRGESEDAETLGSIGCWKVYLYLLTLIDKDDFEEIWPLLVPPMMTLLDDHQIYFKHQGIIAVSAFLARTPPLLLHRTGLADLIQQSLTTAFSFTSASRNVSMIKAALLTNLQLVNLLYPKSTNAAPSAMSHDTTSAHHRRKGVESPALTRFNTLSLIYHSCIITIFTYANSSIPFMTFAFSAIPLLIAELGKGSIRFLGDTMTVLCSSLGGSVASKALASIFSQETVKMHVEAANAIVAFIEVCRDVGRIERWRGLILSSVATLWCNIKEQNHSTSTGKLETALRNVVARLQDVCGEVAQTDCKRMNDLDQELFSELFHLER